ncbi:hypothetical protein [Streptomyces sp. CC77]|uniref:hypothetical protein n=1 Tax=Streptomyces sp. CC77 TaxID=1906739 RepID=UPI0008DCDFA2|nr:hypothetical protein [Streptomyces sp. CC77]OII70567.1 hypothetical protein BJP39_12890 [Streptomyces sp. CC77]
MERQVDSRTYVYDPLRPPSPVPGCLPCLELAAQRAEARFRCDSSAATDANVLLRRHLGEAHEQRV